MKQITAIYVCMMLVLASCSKANQNQITLTASATTVTVGETVLVTANTNTNAISWSVTPSSTAIKQFSITTQRVNSFSFMKAGQYTIGVRARDIAYDSTRHQSIDSCWRAGGADRGGCKHGVDSASVTVTVK